MFHSFGTFGVSTAGYITYGSGIAVVPEDIVPAVPPVEVKDISQGRGLIKRLRKQKAVYWAPLWKNQYGEIEFELPVEISCRWEDMINRELTDIHRKVVTTSTVFVDRNVKQGGRLYKGRLTDLAGQDNVLPTVESGEITAVEIVPNLWKTALLIVATVIPNEWVATT